MQFSSPDEALRRYVVLREKLGAPKGGGGVLHSGPQYAKDCVDPKCAEVTRLRMRREREQDRRARRAGKATPERKKPYHAKWARNGKHHTHTIVCRRCGEPWRYEIRDIRSRDVQHSGGDGPVQALAELGKLARAFRGIDAWAARVWHLRVLGPTIAEVAARTELARGERYKLALGVHTAWTWEDLALEARRRWPRKHAGGFFSERHCRTLVYEARERVEKALCRARLWEHEVSPDGNVICTHREKPVGARADRRVA